MNTKRSKTAIPNRTGDKRTSPDVTLGPNSVIALQRRDCPVSSESLMWAEMISEQEIATRRGLFNLRMYRGDDGSVGAALWQGDITREQHVLCRVHSSCFTSEALGALDCDC